MMLTEFIPLDGGSALRIDAPDGGATVIVTRDDGLHAVMDISPYTMRYLRGGRRPPWNAGLRRAAPAPTTEDQ